MKILELPHRTAPYRCPVNGLCDIYEWKTGQRIPEALIFDSRIGFQLVTSPGGMPPKMIFLSEGGVGKSQYEFWRKKIGYGIIAGDGASFEDTAVEIKILIDEDVPVLLFGLDMFHLPYHKTFYHKIHVPGHVNILVGYDKEFFYVYDNDRNGLQQISPGDLKQAWAKGYLNFSEGNGYFGIDMPMPKKNVREILQEGFHEIAGAFLNGTANNTGKEGYHTLELELTKWAEEYDKKTLGEICRHFITYTGSTIPGLPDEINPYPSGVHNPHQACRDTFAKHLIQYHGSYGHEKWLQAAEYLEKSGALIQETVERTTGFILSDDFTRLPTLAENFAEIEKLEEKALSYLL